MGQVGEGRVLVEDHSLWRALLAAGAERICCALPCRTESSREVQRPVVPSGHTNASWGACAMSREAGWAPKLLPSRGGLERFPGRLNRGDFHAGANMIQASCWEEASMEWRSHTRKTCAPVWSQRLKLGPPDRKLRTNTV